MKFRDPSGKGDFLRRLYPLAVLIAAAAFFLPFLVNGNIFLAADTLYEYFPWRHYVQPGFQPHNTLITDPVNYSYAEHYNRQLKEGTLQNWNPYITGGVPSVNSTSMGTPGRYNPLKLLMHRFLPTHIALMLYLLFHLALMGLSMFLYLSTIGVGEKGALFGATAYMLNGCAMVWFSFETVVPVGSLVPLILFTMEKFLTARKYAFAFGGALLVGSVMLMSHIQYTLYVGLLMGVYALFILYRGYRSGMISKSAFSIITYCAIAGGLGILIGAAETLPLYEAIMNSGRVQRDFEFQQIFKTLGKVPFRFFMTLLFPDYFGSPPLHLNFIPRLPSQEYMNYNELCLYLGIPTLFGVLACAVAVKNIFSRFYLILTVLFVMMLAGTYAYYPFFKWFPGLNKVNPTRLIFLFSFTAAVVSAFGVKGLEDLSKRRRRFFLFASSMLLLSTFLLSVLSSNESVVLAFNRESFRAMPVELSILVGMAAKLRSFASPVMYKPLLLCLASLLLTGLYALFPRRRASSLIFALLLALLCYDLVSFGWNYNTTVKPELIYAETPSISYLKKQAQPFRVLQDVGSGLYVNTLVPFGLQEIGGYTNAYPARASMLLSLVQYGGYYFQGAKFGRWVMFRGAASPLVDLLNVRYVLTSPGTRLPQGKYRLVFEDDLAVFENVEALPRAFGVHRHTVLKDLDSVLRYLGSSTYAMREEVVLEEAPAEDFLRGAGNPAYPPRVDISLYTPDLIRISADFSANGWLVLSDTYYPGWKAYVDGGETPILSANCMLRAVPVPAGEHEIEFQYRPLSVKWGRRLTLAGFLTGLGGLILLARKERAPRAARSG